MSRLGLRRGAGANRLDGDLKTFEPSGRFNAERGAAYPGPVPRNLHFPEEGSPEVRPTTLKVGSLFLGLVNSLVGMGFGTHIPRNP